MVSWYDIFEPKVTNWEARRDLPKLIAGLSNRDLEVRCLAYDALGRLASDETSKVICQALAKEDSPSVRSRAAVALSRLGDGESTIALCNLLSDQDGEVRAAAVRGLGQQRDPEMLSVFCALLDDEYEGVV